MASDNPQTVIVLTRIHPELNKKLVNEAKKEGMNKATLIRRLIIKHFETPIVK